MKRVGLDIRGTRPGFRAHFGRGTGRYATELASRLIPKFAEDSAVPQQTASQTFTTSKDIVVESLTPEMLAGSAFENTLLRLLPAGRQTAHTQWILPRQLGRLNFDLLHFVHHGDGTARCPLPYSVTVLDLIPLRFPELYKPLRSNWRFQLARKLELQSIQNAVGLFAISEATRDDVVEILGYDAERIVVTPLGVDKKFSPRAEIWQEEAKAIRQECGLPQQRPLLFYYGGIDPRKNVAFLFEVLHALHAEGLKPILGLAGPIEKDESYPKLLNALEASGMREHVYFLGFVPEEKLLRLLRGADLHLFPSLYEGFGLPLLEAMACGVPTLAGRNSSLREVMGRDEFLLPDGDVRAWKEAIHGLLQSSEHRQQRVEWGYSRAAKFTWERTAEETQRGYELFLNPKFLARKRPPL